MRKVRLKTRLLETGRVVDVFLGRGAGERHLERADAIAATLERT